MNERTPEERAVDRVVDWIWMAAAVGFAAGLVIGWLT